MPRENKKAKLERAEQVLRELELVYPDARTELEHSNAFELLISTILSAQATDKSVNEATPALFARFPTAFDLAQASPEELMPFIKTIGLYRNKAKNCVLAAKKLVEKHNGEVPNDFDAILDLAGVGRKTANVVLSNAFGRPAIAVDTHVGRLARRLKFSKHENPDKVEKDLEQLFPIETWIFLHHALILHGRRVCDARKPRCFECSLSLLCPTSLS